MQFEKNLVLLRKKKNFSQEDLAFVIGVSRQTIYSWEAGLNYPNIVMLKKIADALDVSTDDLLNGFEVNKLPEVVKGLKLTYLNSLDKQIKCEELPNWFIKLKHDEEVCWALYDLKNNNLIKDYSYHVYTRNKANVHGIDCLEIEVKAYNKELELKQTYNQYISIKNDASAWIAESFLEDGKRIIQTIKDKSFLKDWGIGGKFKYSSMIFNNSEEWELEFNGKKQKVIKISYYDPDGRDDEKAAYFEVFLNQNYESLVWRRYTKNKFKYDDAWTNEEILIDGEKYNLDYYALTSRL